MSPSSLMTDLVKSYFKSYQIALVDNEIIVANVGFVMMAIHTDYALRLDDVPVVPGIDSEGQRGHLVLSDNHVPYHSAYSNAVEAYRVAKRSQKKPGF